MASSSVGIGSTIFYLIFIGIIIFCIKASYAQKGGDVRAAMHQIDPFNALEEWNIEQFVMASKCIQVEDCLFDGGVKKKKEKGKVIWISKNYLGAITFVASVKAPKTMTRVNDVVTIIAF